MKLKLVIFKTCRASRIEATLSSMEEIKKLIKDDFTEGYDVSIYSLDNNQEVFDCDLIKNGSIIVYLDTIGISQILDFPIFNSKASL